MKQERDFTIQFNSIQFNLIQFNLIHAQKRAESTARRQITQMAFHTIINNKGQ